MIWALLISLFFTGGEPLYIIPDIDKYVKRNVQDDDRKETILYYQKLSEKRRKKHSKDKKKFEKAFRRLSLDKTSTEDQFSKKLSDWQETRKIYREEELTFISKAKEKINLQEWEEILAAADKDIQKEIKRVNKIKKRIQKNKRKSNMLIDTKSTYEKHIEDIRPAVNGVFEAQIKYVDYYLNFLSKNDSFLYGYETSRNDFNKTSIEFHQLHDEIYRKIMRSHFLLKDRTDNNKWRRLIRKTDLEK